MDEMPRTTLRGNGRSTSRIGLGMATVMREPSSLRRRALLERAHELGVRHFDVAPLYGLGRAESDLGVFLASGVEDATVTTKFGRSLSGPARLLAPVQRPLRAAMRVGRLRRLGKTAEKSVGSAVAVEPVGLARSVQKSLDLLRLDRVDILALHDVAWTPSWTHVWPDIQRGPGYDLLGISGATEVLDEYPQDVVTQAHVIQTPPSFDRPGTEASQQILHSALHELARPVLAALPLLDDAARRDLREGLGSELDAHAVRAIVVAGLLGRRPDNIVLVGTSSAAHLEALVTRAARLQASGGPGLTIAQQIVDTQVSRIARTVS